MCIKINGKVAFLIWYSRTKKSKYCCHPPIFCHHYSKFLSPTLPKLMNWILLSPPPLSSDPDNPPKFGTCTSGPKSIGNIFRIKFTNLAIHDFGISGPITAAAVGLTKGRKPERPRPHADLGSPNQCKVSITGQMRHVKLGLAKPEVTEVFNPNVRHIKVSKHLF